jgi:hypothetical protein
LTGTAGIAKVKGSSQTVPPSLIVPRLAAGDPFPEKHVVFPQQQNYKESSEMIRAFSFVQVMTPKEE